MAEALKDFYTRAVVERIGESFARQLPSFDLRKFVRQAMADFAELALIARGRAIMTALHAQLPSDPKRVSELLVGSLGPTIADTLGSGMAPFMYLPHTLFVAEHLAPHFELAMTAQHAITQRFTAEASIRTFIQRYPEQCFERLTQWTTDPSAHVRRLVSEGTRARLPWAMRVAFLDANPQRVLELLTRLKDDDSEYVRRSVANNLNDIGKLYPELLLETCSSWAKGASPEREKLIRHALRHAVKRGDQGAIVLLGGGQGKHLEVTGTVSPKTVRIGDKVRVTVLVTNPTRKSLSSIVDLRVTFPRPSGKGSAKVFKLSKVELGPGASKELSKLVSLAVHTTRKPHPGKHVVAIMVDGQAREFGSFQLRAT